MKLLHRALLAAAIFVAAACPAGAAALETAQCLQMPAAAKAGDAGDSFVNSSRDIGNVTVMELGGDYDRHLGEPRRLVAQEYLRTHPDRYDFLIVFTTFEFATGDALAFYNAVRNDTAGIGQPQFDVSQEFGSSGRLQGYVDMAATTRYALATRSPNFEHTRNTLAHELMHRWGAHVSYRNEQGTLSRDLIGSDDSHWSYFLDSDASLMYGNDWSPRADGRFESTSVRYRYSPLDLYLAGFAAAAEVSPLRLIRGGNGAATDLPQLGAISGGSSETVRIEQIIAAEGPRNPAAATAQKDFRAAFILLVRPNETPPPQTVAALEALRVRVQQHFAQVTDGRGTLRIFNELRGDGAEPQLPQILNLPANGGGTGISQAVAWVKQRQRADGHWEDRPATALRDTVAALQLLQQVEPGFAGLATARNWLAAQTPRNHDAQSWQLVAGNGSSENLVQAQSASGGWGLVTGLQDSPLDSALVAAALGQRDPSQPALQRALQALAATQNADGSFGAVAQGRGRLLPTVHAARAFGLAQGSGNLALRDSATTWILGRETAEGGLWKDDVNSLSATIELYSVAAELLLDVSTRQRLREGVRTRQDAYGSWNSSIYLTAMAALSALREQRINLAITATPVALPAAPVDGDLVQLEAVVANLGGSTAPAFSARWYRGHPDQGGVAIGADIAVPSLLVGQRTTIRQLWPSRDHAGANTLWLWLDPADAIEETSEEDNRIALALPVASAPTAPDLVLDASLVSVDPASVSQLPQTVRVSGVLRNLGTTAAPASLLRLSSESEPVRVLAEASVSVPARGEAPITLEFQATAPQSLRLLLQADADQRIAEAREDNNQLRLNLPFGQTQDLALDAGALSLLGTTAPHIGRDVEFAVQIRNRGTQDASQVPLLVEVVQGASTTTLSVAGDAVTVAAGQVQEKRYRWRALSAGPAQLRVVLDPANQFAESDESNNAGNLDFSVGTATRPDLFAVPGSLQFTPEPGLQNGALQVSLRVRNSTNQAAGSFRVALYTSDPSQGGLQLGASSIAGLAGETETPVQISIPSLPLRSDTTLQLVIDAAEQVDEDDEGNNVVLHTLSVLPLADIAVSAAGVTLTPSQPAAGAPLQARVRVRNTGSQPSGAFSVRLYEGPADGGSAVASDQNVANLAAGAEIDLVWNWTFAANTTPEQLTVVADIANTVSENEKRNNTAIVPLDVQQRGFYASERYFSPNGDSVRDETVLYFARPGAGNLRVDILNGVGRLQRRFDALDPASQGGGQVAWDGRDERGRIAPDGDYSAVLRRDGAEIARLTVTLDLNRSNFLETLGTRHEIRHELLRNVSWRWPPSTPSTRGYVYGLFNPDLGTPRAAGIYRVSTLTNEREDVVTQQWVEDFGAGVIAHIYSNYAFSPDGRLIAFLIRQGDHIALAVAASDAPDRVRVLLPSLMAYDPGLNLQPLTFVDARTVVVGDLAQRWNVNVETGAMAPERALPPDTSEVRVFSHGSYALKSSGVDDEDVAYYLPRDSQRPVVQLPAHTELLQISADGTTVALRRVAGERETIHLFDAPTAQSHAIVDDALQVFTFDDATYPESRRHLYRHLTTQLIGENNDLVVVDGLRREVKLWSRHGQLRQLAALPALDTDALPPYESRFLSVPHVVGTVPDFASRDVYLSTPHIRRPQLAPLYDPARRRVTVMISTDFLGTYNNEGIVSPFQQAAQDEVFAVDVDSGDVEATDLFLLNDSAVGRLPNRYFADGSLLREDGRYQSGASPLSEQPWEGKPFLKDYWNYPFALAYSPDDDGAMFEPAEKERRLSATLTNQTTALWARSNERSIELSGAAADRNFANYRLDYALQSAPGNWLSLSAPSRDEVLVDEFLAWVPPEPGNYLIRLTVQDKAGNQQTAYASAYSAVGSPIDNVTPPARLISPNGDGIKDSTTITYRVRHASSFAVEIRTASGALVRRDELVYTAANLGEHSFTWDGRDQGGQPVADGRYLLQIAGNRYSITLDTQAPQLRMVYEQPLMLYTNLQGTEQRGSYLMAYAGATDPHLERVNLQLSPHAENRWTDEPDTFAEDIQLVGKDVRAVASDLAGNRTLANPVSSVEQVTTADCYFNCAWQMAVSGKSRSQGYLVQHPLPADFDPDPEQEFKIFRGFDPWVTVRLLAQDVSAIELQFASAPYYSQPATAWQTLATLPMSQAQAFDPVTREAVFALPQLAALSAGSRIKIRTPGLRSDGSRIPANEMVATIEGIPSLYRYCYTEATPPGEMGKLIDLAKPGPNQVAIIAPRISTDPRLRTELSIIDADGRETRRFDTATVGSRFGKSFVIPSSSSERAVAIYSLPGRADYRTEPVTIAGCGPTEVSGAEIAAYVDPACGSAPTGRFHVKVFGQQPDSLRVADFTADGSTVLINETPPLNNGSVSGYPWSRGFDWVTTMHPENTRGILDLRLEYPPPQAPMGGELYAPVVRTPASLLVEFPAEGQRVCANHYPNGVIGQNASYFASRGRIMSRSPSYWSHKMSYADGSGHPLCFDSERIGCWQGEPGPVQPNGNVPVGMGNTNVNGIILEPNPILTPSLFAFNGTVTLQTAVSDTSGATVCDVRQFTFDTKLELSRERATDALDFWYLSTSTIENAFGSSPVLGISHNGSPRYRRARLQFKADEALEYRLSLHRITADLENSTFTLAEELAEVERRSDVIGHFNVDWDGKINGVPASDGYYALRGHVEDICGYERDFFVIVVVDSTPPQLAIHTPAQGAEFTAAVITSTGSVNDPHFSRFQSAYGQWELYALRQPGDNGLRIGEGALPIEVDGPLGQWNRGAFSGAAAFLLVATDDFGNRAETQVNFSIPTPAGLIGGIDARPPLFSPNDDDRLDQTRIDLLLLDRANLDITLRNSGGSVLATLALDRQFAAGIGSVSWNGRGPGGSTIADGSYRVHVIARDPAHPGVEETAEIPLRIDTVAPLITETSPDGTFAGSDEVVAFRVDDAELDSYEAKLIARDSGDVVAQLTGALRTRQRLADLRDRAEGDYRLEILAQDRAGNRREFQHDFTLDRTPPTVDLLAPVEGAVIARNGTAVELRGSVADTHLADYSVDIAPVGNDNWTTIASGTAAVSAAALGSWNVTQPDGDYRLRLRARDQAGNNSEVLHTVSVDGTPPLAEIDSPANGAALRDRIVLQGSASDAHLQEYTVAVATTAAAAANQWTLLYRSETSTSDSELADLPMGLPEGDYVLRLRALDKAGFSAEARVNLRLDRQPPPVPLQLRLRREGADVVLDWNAVSAEDLAGYAVYRNDVRLNAEPVPANHYVDSAVADGRWRYHVRAVDRAGNESAPSNTVELTLDREPPQVQIHAPVANERVRGRAAILATAYSIDDFDSYQLSAQPADQSTAPALLATGTLPQQMRVLAEWDTLAIADETPMRLRLSARDRNGNEAVSEVVVVVDNGPPAAPQGLIATLDNDDAQVSWNANSEADLLGYLLYRDGRLVNGPAQLPADLRAFALSAISFADPNLGDGEHRYVVFAIDRAGNISAPSNTATVGPIESGPPDLRIDAPENDFRFEQSVEVRASSRDLDIVSVEFAWRANGGSWTTFATLSAPPYRTSWTPGTLPYADYEIRALATDSSGQADPEPPQVWVRYADLTAPQAPAALRAVADGGDVRLDWDASASSDVAGYRLEREQGDWFVVAPDTTALTLTDTNRYDSLWRYRVRAVDGYGNLSEPVTATANVFSISVQQPFTPTSEAAVALQGSSPLSGRIDVHIEHGAGSSDLPPTNTDSEGRIALTALPLLAGDNHVFVRVIAAGGHRSRAAELWLTRGNAPAAPTGVNAVANAHDVTLGWTPNSENDVVGYRTEHNGQIRPDVDASGMTATSDHCCTPQAAVDGDAGTSWQLDAWLDPPALESATDPTLEITLPQPAVVTAIQLDWLAADKATGNIDVYARSTHGAWLRVLQQRGAASVNAGYNFAGTYRTDALRLVLRSPDDDSRYMNLGLAEVRLRTWDLLATPPMTHTVIDGNHRYRVQAVNALGFASAWSQAAEVAVGDATPPDAVVLSVALDGSTATATWTASTSPDVARYELRRDGSGIATLPAAAERRHVDTNLSLGAHEYQVVAIDAFGNVSAPSNKVVVTVQGEGPGMPQNLRVTALPAGGTLSLSWSAGTGATPVSWLLRRALAAEGPYVDIAQVSTMTHVDSGLTNGTRYHYVVIAIDAAGNRSVPSASASGVPYDGTAPAPPLLTYPTDSEHRIATRSERLPFCGKAEAGSRIELQRGGELYASAVAATAFASHTYAITLLGPGARVAPDGVHIVTPRGNDNSVVVDIRTRAERALAAGAQQPQWAEHGDRVYYWRDNGLEFQPVAGAAVVTGIRAEEVRRYAIAADETHLLLAGRYANGAAAAEDGLWWIALNGGQARRINGILLEDLIQAELPLSHDARFALAADYGLRWQLLDLALGTTIAAIDGNTDVTPSWSPDSRRFAFSRLGNSSNSSQLWIYDAVTAQPRLVAELPRQIGFVAWSPDGGEIAVGAEDRLYVFDAVSGIARADAPTLLSTPDAASARWSASGRLLLPDAIGIVAITPPGWFCSADTALRPGINRVDAAATDAAGNRGLASYAIEVELAGTALPDLVLQASDVFFTPATAQPGQNVSALFTLRNRGQAAVAAPELSLQLTAPDGSQRTLALSQAIGSIAAGAARSLALQLGTLDQVGQYRLRLVADPSNQLVESDENNNSADAFIAVIADAQPLLDLSTSRALYSPGERVDGEIRVSNPGTPFNGRLRAQVVDADGHLVVDLGETAIAELGYAQRTLRAVSWNAAGAFAGDYRLRAQLLGSSGTVLAERSVSFAIAAVRHIQLGIAAEPASLPAGASALIASSLQFRDGNALLAGASLRAAVIDGGGNEVWSRTHSLGTLAPGYELRKEDMWNSAGAAAGVYALRLQLTAGDLLQTAESSLLLQGSGAPQLSGSLALAPAAQLIAGQAGSLAYRLVNSGSAVSGAELRLRVFQALDQPPLFERSETIALASGGEFSAQLALEAPPLSLREHVGVLDIRLPGDAAGSYRLLARQGFQVIDAQPPQISVLQPAADSWQPALLRISADITDLHSSVAAAELRIDNGGWQPVSRGSDGRYTRSVDGIADGSHSVVVRARDSWGNERVSAPVAFRVDALAPQIQIDGIAEGALTNLPVQIQVQITEANPDTAQTSIRLDGQDYVPGTTISSDGDHVIAVRAQDLAGNLSQATRRFRIDRTPPPLSVLQPADGAVVDASSIAVLTQSEAAAQVQLSVGSHTAQLQAGSDGRADFSSVPLVEGDNRIELQASDLAGNRSAIVAVNVRYQPSTALPLVGTLQSALSELPHGSDLQLSLRLRNPGTQALPEQQLRLGVYAAGNTLLAQREYTRAFAAGEEFTDTPSFATTTWPLGSLSLRLEILRNGNWTVLDDASVELVDRTPPQLQALAPLQGAVLASPLRLRASASDALSAPVTVEYRLDNGAWLALDAVAGQPGNFQSSVLKLADGDYSYTLRATDAAGNVAETAAITFAFDNTAPQISISGVADGDLLNHAVTPVISIVEAHPGSSEIRLDGQPFTSGTSVATHGSHTLRVEARDAAGNESALEIHFTLDLQAPVVVVTSPQHGSTVSVAAQEIIGSTEAEADVEIDAPGLQVTLRADAAGNFHSVPATLQPGLNTIRLRATDRAGNQSEEKVVQVTYQPSQAQTASAQFLEQPRVRRGQPLIARYRVLNTGSTALAATAVRAELRSASGGDVIATDTWSLDLATQQEVEHSSTFATAALAAGAYRISVSAQLRDAAGTLHWVDLAGTDATVLSFCSSPRAPDTLFRNGFDWPDALFCDDFELYAALAQTPAKHAGRTAKDQP